MKRLKTEFGCAAIGAILLAQTCWLLCIALTMLIWSALKSKRQKRFGISRFREELKRQGVPDELVGYVVKRYGKAFRWVDMLKLYKGH